MDAWIIRHMALISACNARVAGMNAENEHRSACGFSIAYREEMFLAEAAELERLAAEVIRQPLNG